MAKQTIEKLREPTAELIELKECLQHAIANDWFNKDPVFAKFVYEEVAPGLMKLLARERSNQPPVRNQIHLRIKLTSPFHLVSGSCRRANQGLHKHLCP